MTDHDYWLEDMQAMKKRKKPNYTRRRILFAIVSIGLISSLTIMLTWHGGSTTTSAPQDMSRRTIWFLLRREATDAGAFSSEVETGSREENATEQKLRTPALIPSKRRGSRSARAVRAR